MQVQLLSALCEINAPSGDEGEMTRFITRVLKENRIDYDTDILGNVFVELKGKSKDTIVVVAHMDEVGLIVSGIHDGKIYCAPVGGLLLESALGAQVEVVSREGRVIQGLLTSVKVAREQRAREKEASQQKAGAKESNENRSRKEKETTTREERGHTRERESDVIHQLYIDTGESDKELERMGIDVGTRVQFITKTRLKEDMILAKALDNRIGCFVLLEVIGSLIQLRHRHSPSKHGKHPFKKSLLFVFSTQEEVMLRSGLNRVADWPVQEIVCIDMVPVSNNVSDGDMPAGSHLSDVDAESQGDHNRLNVGGGPVVVLLDGSGFKSKSLVDQVLRVAQTLDIPLQYDLSVEGETDDSRIAPTLPDPVPTLILSVAVGDMHTPVNRASLEDISDLAILLLQYLHTKID